MKCRKELKPQQLERSLHSEVYRLLALACTGPCVRYPIFFGPLESTMPSHAKTLLRRLISFDLKVYSSPTAMSAQLPASRVFPPAQLLLALLKYILTKSFVAL
jgi:hypothetical protein